MMELFTFCIFAYISLKLKLLDRKKFQEVDKVIIELKTSQQRDQQLKLMLEGLEEGILLL